MTRAMQETGVTRSNRGSAFIIWNFEWHVDLCVFFFFFQAEDGIRDLTVTGVQTCALPIYRLQVVEGVSSIYIGGQKRFAMRLWLDSKRMAAHQITVLDVQDALRQQNVEIGRASCRGRG